MPLKVLHFASTNLGKFYLISIQNNRFVKGSFYNELTALLSLWYLPKPLLRLVSLNFITTASTT